MQFETVYQPILDLSSQFCISSYLFPRSYNTFFWGAIKLVSAFPSPLFCSAFFHHLQEYRSFFLHSKCLTRHDYAASMCVVLARYLMYVHAMSWNTHKKRKQKRGVTLCNTPRYFTSRAPTKRLDRLLLTLLKFILHMEPAVSDASRR